MPAPPLRQRDPLGTRKQEFPGKKAARVGLSPVIFDRLMFMTFSWSFMASQAASKSAWAAFSRRLLVMGSRWRRGQQAVYVRPAGLVELHTKVAVLAAEVALDGGGAEHRIAEIIEDN